MKERPILFSAPMVRAILDGTKTQTRRIVKPHGAHHLFQFRGKEWLKGADEPTGEWGWCSSDRVVSKHIHCPFGKSGDRLWVRETFSPIYPQDPAYNGGQPIEYDYAATYRTGDRLGDSLGIKKVWKPSIHMPRDASRILLEVTDVRIERLQDISQADARAEGAPPSHPSINRVSRKMGYADFPRSWYAQLWEQINGAGSWEANPWVWVVEFKQVQTESHR